MSRTIIFRAADRWRMKAAVVTVLGGSETLSLQGMPDPVAAGSLAHDTSPPGANGWRQARTTG